MISGRSTIIKGKELSLPTSPGHISKRETHFVNKNSSRIRSRRSNKSTLGSLSQSLSEKSFDTSFSKKIYELRSKRSLSETRKSSTRTNSESKRSKDFEKHLDLLRGKRKITCRNSSEYSVLSNNQYVPSICSSVVSRSSRSTRRSNRSFASSGYSSVFSDSTLNSIYKPYFKKYKMRKKLLNPKDQKDRKTTEKKPPKSENFVRQPTPTPATASEGLKKVEKVNIEQEKAKKELDELKEFLSEVMGHIDFEGMELDDGDKFQSLKKRFPTFVKPRTLEQESLPYFEEDFRKKKIRQIFDHRGCLIFRNARNVPNRFAK